ncbi:heparinase II/III-like protein [Melghirimyces profundicolus]|uniref:Heparinase II/III-like protein n=1 Tax=Melghirimyces profundicolus TaxID=1242148 RepID=A0A2T6C9D7_9BACL|nr:heparinase II/III family protein [Melghirimyces profundicolus]PTX64893.1 heparinase II/III-like protein [Melghirimyces profundicolus]
MKGSILLLVALLTLSAALFGTLPARADPEWKNVKTRSTFYTPKKVANARKNVKKYDWAKEIKNHAVLDAEKYLDFGVENLWNAVTTQNLPRSFAVNLELGSPITGKEFNEKYGYRGWQADPLNEPWKLTDPSSGYKFPTNDFASYYKSGLDEHGNFDPEKADKRYLVNELYPEKGKYWGVDDGTGWVDEDGNRWTFVAYYNHWHVWHGGVVDKALRAFRDAYLYTGDVKYAQAGTILLDRIADVYPEMDVSVYKWEDGFLHSHGGTGKGKVRGSIWEATAAIHYLSAYDAFFPGMEEADVIPFLNAKAQKYHMDNPKNTVSAIRKNIEDGLLREIYPAVKNAQIRGNFGMHQRTLAMAAVVLDEPGTSEEWIDWVFQPGELRSQPDWHLTGGNVMATLLNQVDRDGFGDEPSTQYNSYWLTQIQGVADILEGYDRYPKADLYQNVKFRKMFDTRYPLVMGNRYTPQIGDSFRTGNPGIVGTVQEHVDAFTRYRKPVYAQMAYLLNGNSTDGLHGSLFDADPEQVSRDIRKVLEEEGPLKQRETHLPGFGFAALRDGGNVPSTHQETSFFFFSNLKRLESTAEVIEHQGPIHLETDEWGKRDPEAFDIPEDYYAETGSIQLESRKRGDRISFRFKSPQTGNYVLELMPLSASSYGIYELKVDGKQVGTHDFYGSGNKGGSRSVGSLKLEKGEHTLTFINRGKNPRATGYKLGLTGMALKPASDSKTSSGGNSKRRGLWMYYGKNLVGRHGHKDTLNIGYHAFGLDLSPDLGYPDNFKNRTEWVSNTVSHNTVVVDQTKQHDSLSSIPHHFDSSSRVQLIDVDAPHVYPQTEQYRRTTAMIRVDDQNSYAVDFFRIQGGDHHHFSFHGAEGLTTVDGLNLTEQKRGTYAGEDVHYGEKEPDQPSGWEYAGSGFHYLTNVERAQNPNGPFSVDWKIRDTWSVLPEEKNIHLRLTLLNQVDDAALADGIPPRLPGNPKRLRYLIAHREGKNLKSQFVSLLEAYQDERFIRSVTPVELTVDGKKVTHHRACALKVELKNGRVDTIVNSLDPDVTYTIGEKLRFQGFFGVYSEKNGKPVYAYLNDGKFISPAGKPLLQNKKARIKGTILTFTKELSIRNEITVKLKDKLHSPESVIGRTIFIDNDGERNAAYEIKGIRHLQGNRYTLDIGSSTLIRKTKDPKNMSKGFVYNIKEGQTWRIPLSAEWSTP